LGITWRFGVRCRRWQLKECSMSAPVEDLVAANRLVHEPARARDFDGLSACRKADFRFLQSITGLPQGNLCGHLAKLEAVGLITIEKTFQGKYPQTWLEITASCPHGPSALSCASCRHAGGCSPPFSRS
jgi:hypothetical protein